MDPVIMGYIVAAIGGAVGGNILGALTRGGGGLVGRTLIGAIGGAGLAYTASATGLNVEMVSTITNMVPTFIEGENGVHLSNLIKGAGGGGILGLVGGLLIRPSN